MPSVLSKAIVPLAVLLSCGLAVVAIIVASGSRPATLVNAASTSPSTIEPAILTSGDAVVSKKPDLAVVGAGVEAQDSTASAAQSDLAAKAGKLIARIKALPTA